MSTSAAPQPAQRLRLPDLTLPARDISTMKAVFNAYVRRLLRDFTSVPSGAPSEPVASLHRRVVERLQPALRTDPRRVAFALRQPTLSTLLVTMQRHYGPDGDHAALDAWLRELCLLLLLELAAQNDPLVDGFTIPVESPLPPLRSLLTNLLIETDDSVDSITFASGKVVFTAGGKAHEVVLAAPDVPGAPLRISRPYHPIVDRVCLALTDNNPLSDFEAHPDKSGNTLDLGGRSAGDWVDVLRQSFELVDRYLPLIGEEMRLVLRQIVPVGWHEERHLSASYQEAVGTIYMTLHPNLMTMTEALIHEFQHNKINAAFHLDPMLHNAFWPLYTSPVRPDPRPLHGVILAVHAFQPVARLYETMAADRHPFTENPAWRRRFQQILKGNQAGASTVLSNAQPTILGRDLFAEMRAIDERYRRYEAANFQSDPGVQPVLMVE